MKFCPRCKISKSVVHFYKSSKTADGRRSWCKLCCNEDNNKREPRYIEHRKQYAVTDKGREVRKKATRKFYASFRGRLKRVYYDIKQRCNNPNCKAFKNYGGRGIQNKFKCFDEFYNYIMVELRIISREQICGLQIDRTDNNGHYEPGNIRFVTAKENLKNRRNSKRKGLTFRPDYGMIGE